MSRRATDSIIQQTTAAAEATELTLRQKELQSTIGGGVSAAVGATVNGADAVVAEKARAVADDEFRSPETWSMGSGGSDVQVLRLSLRLS